MNVVFLALTDFGGKRFISNVFIIIIYLFCFVLTLVYAMDGAFPARYDMATVLVYVMDVNDNNPTFAPPTFDITLPENQSPGVIHNAIATDADEGPNGDLIYSITGKHD